MKKFFATTQQNLSVDIALLFLRIVTGIAFIFHGWGKIQAPMSWMGDAVPGIFQLLGAVAEFGGGIALIIGLVSNLASLGLFFTMLVATFFHAVIQGDPFFSKGGPSYELAMVFLAISALLTVIGPGRFSLDYKIFGVKSSNL